MSTALLTIAPSNVMQFKAVRLAALQDSPTAFGSTYAKESKLTDADWLARSKRWAGDTAIGCLAIDSHHPVGILLCTMDERDPTRAEAISMWVAPTHRRRGVGQMLIDAIVNWCRKKDVQMLTLMVTNSNAVALAFYRRLGFEMTGRTEPYPNDPALFEYEMCRAVTGPRESLRP
jgi:ribosomal protein S18 acetylase RimI-like enzyme